KVEAVTDFCNRTCLILLSAAGKISKEKSFNRIDRDYCVELSHVILMTGRVIRRHILEKTRVPQRTIVDLRVFENPIYMSLQVSLKPNSVRQIFVQSDYS